MAATPSQDSIRSTPLTRMADLAGTGARVGMNYLKYYGQRAVTPQTAQPALREELDAVNAKAVYDSFSRLKGGPLKLAQMLSIDQNLLPPAYASQFAQAQYSAPPLSWPLVRRTLEREFGQPVEALYDTFSREAAHGASIGQVHVATRAGKKLAVKVQYPGVAESMRSDLRVVKPVALQMFGLREEDIAHYFTEVETRLLEETDYVTELRRSQEIAAACAPLERLRFPTFYPDRCSNRVLTMDWIDGLTLDRFAASDASQESRNEIGQALWDFYQHQIHVLHVFHADPHPGNFLVADGFLYVLDFGCTRAITPEFHAQQFAFLNPALLESDAKLEQSLRDMDVLLPGDSAPQRKKIMDLARESIEVLTRPFRAGRFDFADPGFMQTLYAMGEASRQDRELRSLRGARGRAESVYVNRAFFGLFSLLHRLGAVVKTQ
ncbi:AarF/UbiB family protein [Prosthecobacter algae]|uniref:AarF/UbiB family protein n=1 Tax=Prosthecobacter algae TaxID=1144682 RepID=A0ABP9NYW6_9BACT